MEKKQRFFIYDRKEAGVLVLLGVMVAVFAFTLGVHLGKKVGFKGLNHPETGISPLATAPEAIETPTTPVAGEPQSAQVPQNAPGGAGGASVPGVDEGLNQALHDEVAHTGIKLDQAHQVDLPAKTRSENGGATTLSGDESKSARSSGANPEESRQEPRSEAQPQPKFERRDSQMKRAPVRREIFSAPSPRKFYTLQIGSFSALTDAKLRVSGLEAQGVKPSIHIAEIKGKGTWYRIYLGGFATREEAEKAGQQYRANHVIDSYIVTKAVD